MFIPVRVTAEKSDTTQENVLKPLHRGRVRRTGLHSDWVYWSLAYHPVPTNTGRASRTGSPKKVSGREEPLADRARDKHPPLPRLLRRYEKRAQ